MKHKFNLRFKICIKTFMISLMCFMYLSSSAQIGFLTNNPDPSAQLDIFSNNKGLLIPRIILTNDLTNPSPIISPATGLLIFNSGVAQTQGFYFWNGIKWILIKTPNIVEIIGPSISTDNAAVRFDGTSGKIVQNSGVIINDNNEINSVNNITLNGFKLTSSSSTGKILVSDANGNASWQTAPPIDVKNNNILVTANVSDLNFEGGTKIKDAGNNSAKIIFYTNNVTKDVIQLSSSDSIDLNVLSGVASITWNIEEHKDASTFIHSTTSTPSRIYVNKSGIYELNYMFSAINKTIKRKTLRTRIRKNGTIFLNHITSYSFSYQEADDKITHSSSSFLITLQANDYIEVVVNGQTNNGSINMMSNENIFFLRLMRTL